MIQMIDRPNTTPIGQDRESLTFKALPYLNVTVHAQVCRLFCAVYLTIILRNRAEYRLILSRRGRRPSRLKSDDIPRD